MTNVAATTWSDNRRDDNTAIAKEEMKPAEKEIQKKWKWKPVMKGVSMKKLLNVKNNIDNKFESTHQWPMTP